MKTKILYILSAVLLCGIPVVTSAQESGGFDDRQGRADFSGHWQIAIPMGMDYADNSSGWGANFEGHYFVTDRLAIGAFVSWQTFIKYEGRQTYQLTGDSNTGGAITYDQYQTVFELPFGLSSRFHFLPAGMFDPYVGLKLGANFSEQRKYFNIYESDYENWGFNVMPELGAMISPVPNQAVGLHVAVFYAYSTNSNDYFDISGLNHLGFRVGVNFRF